MNTFEQKTFKKENPSNEAISQAIPSTEEKPEEKPLTEVLQPQQPSNPSRPPLPFQKSSLVPVPEKIIPENAHFNYEWLKYCTQRQFIQQQLKATYAFEFYGPHECNIYKYKKNLGIWELIDQSEFLDDFLNWLSFIYSKKILLPFEIGNSGILAFVDKHALRMCKDALGFKRKNIPVNKGLNFLNGFLNLVENQNVLITDKNSNEGLNVKGLMLTHCIPYHYNSEVLPSLEFFIILFKMFNFKFNSLFSFRNLIKILIEGPYMDLQTGFLFWGPPASGKSKLINLLIEIVGMEQIVNFRPKEFENLFALQNVVGKRIVLLSEVGSIGFETINNLKMLTGRDPISPNEKYKNYRETTKFEGTVVMSTNSSPDILSTDLGLLNRILDIETVPLQDRINNFNSLFQFNLIRLINWARCMPPEELVVRANQVTPFSRKENQ